MRGISFERIPRPRHTVGPIDRAPTNFADISLRRAWNTTHRRHGLGHDRTASYPLLAVRKTAPTVAEDRLVTSNAPGVSSGPKKKTLRKVYSQVVRKPAHNASRIEENCFQNQTLNLTIIHKRCLLRLLAITPSAVWRRAVGGSSPLSG